MRSRGCAVQNKIIYLNKRNQLSTLPTVAHWITRNQTRNARPLRPCSNMGYYFTSKYGQKRGLEEFTSTFRGTMNLLPSQPRFLARLTRWQQTPMKYSETIVTYSDLFSRENNIFFTFENVMILQESSSGISSVFK